jgi:hypothetical protein
MPVAVQRAMTRIRRKNSHGSVAGAPVFLKKLLAEDGRLSK